MASIARFQIKKTERSGRCAHVHVCVLVHVHVHAYMILCMCSDACLHKGRTRVLSLQTIALSVPSRLWPDPSKQSGSCHRCTDGKPGPLYRYTCLPVLH